MVPTSARAIALAAESLAARLEQRLAETRPDLPTEMHAGFAQLRTEIANLRTELIKWMFLFWLGTVAAPIFTR
jgi:hypothetical protein